MIVLLFAVNGDAGCGGHGLVTRPDHRQMLQGRYLPALAVTPTRPVAAYVQ
jgi:hypothetical protein